MNPMNPKVHSHNTSALAQLYARTVGLARYFNRSSHQSLHNKETGTFEIKFSRGRHTALGWTAAILNFARVNSTVLLGVVLTATGVLPVKADYQTEVLADSPLVYYRLDETNSTTAANLGSLASAADGTYSEITTNVLLGQSSASAGLGTAAKLNHGQIRMPDLGQGPLDQFTVELWINRQSDPGLGALFAIYAGDGFSGNTLHLNLAASGLGSPLLQFAIPNSGPQPQFFPMWPTNEWHHLVVTRDGTTSAVRAYLDGNFLSEGTKGVGPEFTGGDIGDWGATRYLDAMIDEFAIYPTVLSDARIAAHFNAAQLTLDPPVIVSQPQSATVYVGDPVTLAAVARGQALAFQWFKTNAPIPGATNFSYIIGSAAVADGGSYALQVSNLVSSVMSSNAVLTVSVVPKPVSLLSHWTFDTDTVANTTELRNAVAGRANGVFRDASAGFAPTPPTLSTTDTKVGDGALEFNGKTLLQLFDDAALNNLPAYTFAAWVKVNGFDDPSGIASIFSYDGAAPPNGQLQINAYDDGHLDLNTHGDGVFESPAPSGWFHLAFTHDATAGVTNAILYLNGVAVTNGPANLTGSLATGGTTFGSFGWVPRRLIGLIDDVRIYDGALTAAQIAALPGGVAAILGSSRSGNQLTLSWTASGFSLQENSDLGNPAGWTDVAGGGTSPVIVTTGADNKFYRLVKL